MAPKICIIPSESSPASSSNAPTTFITLPHPRTAAPTRYLLHPTLGLHEFTHLPSRSSVPRSWLLTPTSPIVSPVPTTWLSSGHIISDSSLYVSTRIDPLFLLLPFLHPEKADASIGTRFVPLDDIFDSLTSKSDRSTAHWTALLQPESAVCRHVGARIRAVSDSVDVGGELAYRVNEKKLLSVLVRKCEAMAEGGLPKSLEEEFIVKPLVKPLTAVAETAPLPTPAVEGEENGAGESKKTLEVRGEGGDEEKVEDGTNEAPTALPTPPETQAASDAPAQDPITATSDNTIEDKSDSHLQHLLRLRVASQFLASSYLPPHLEAKLLAYLSTLHDFSALDTQLAELKRQRAEATAIRSTDFSMKRGMADEDADDRAEKKRKKEEEEKKKKKNVTQGVRNLSKVNTRGMAKMTSFFKKVEPKK